MTVNYWNGSAWQWADQGAPPGTTASGVPAVLTYSAGGTQVFDAFVTGANGHLDVNYWNGSSWQWADQGVPPGTTVSGVPGVITYSAGGIQLLDVFVRGANGHLDVNYWNGSAWQWADQGLPPSTTASAAPGVISYLAGGTQLLDVFVTGANGHLDVNYWTGSAWQWADQGTPAGSTVSGVPAILTYEQGGTRLLDVFVTGANGHLYVNYWNGSAWNWADQGVPPGTTVSGAPEVISYIQGDQLLIDVFVIGENGHLYVNYWDGLSWNWADQGVPSSTTASGVPGLTTYTQGGTQVFDAFVMGANGTLDVNYWNGSAWNWADQGAIP